MIKKAETDAGDILIARPDGVLVFWVSDRAVTILESQAKGFEGMIGFKMHAESLSRFAELMLKAGELAGDLPTVGKGE